MLIARESAIERLRQIIKELQRHRFGRRAETLPEDQLCWPWKRPSRSKPWASPRPRRRRPRRPPGSRSAARTAARCRRICRGSRRWSISRATSVPAVPKYAGRSCEDVVVQAPAPARLIEGGIPTKATVAQVRVSKYADHLLLYRQARIYAR
ncbi:hypothetical protein [Ancylobacter oerskovii]|uniref:Transposase TnpC homeodomain domain-containing protein n=2 Tax=Ancylobacter oerskovii TaxID=459519 RepID=A0ABW4Z600_9HYPH